jgi:hypothetical protein
MVMAVAALACTGAGLSYDGSYLLFRTLESGRPWVEHSRLTHVIFQLVPAAAGLLTHNLGLVVFLFSLSWATPPLLATAACWCLVRRRQPQAFVWCALGAALAALPSQICLISDMTIVQQAFWPLLAGLVAGVDRRSAWLVIPFGLIVAFSHPVGIAVFGLLAAIALLKALRRPSERTCALQWAAVCFAMAGVAAAYDAWQADPYEKGLLSVGTLIGTWASSVRGAPLSAVVWSWVAALAMAVEPRWLRRRWPMRLAPAVVTACALAAVGLTLVPWAWWPTRWVGAIGFRFYVLAAAAPFVLAMVEESLGSPEGAEGAAPVASLSARRAWYATAVAAIVCATIAAQSLSWRDLCLRLEATMAASSQPCQSLDRPEYRWTGTNVMQHFSVTTTSMILQGSRPATIVMPPGHCADGAGRDRLYIASWYSHPLPARWFDLGGLRP